MGAGPDESTWETVSALPRGASYEQMLEFFGIPPCPLDALDGNVMKKRRRWYRMSNSGNPAGRQKAAEVLALIQRVSEALMHGMADGQGGSDPRSLLAEMPEPIDLTSHGLGITWLDERTLEEVNQIVIPSQTPVPVRGEKIFVTMSDNQSEMKIELNEGDDEDLDFVRSLASGTARFGKPVPRGYPVRVEIGYDRAGLIALNAYDGRTGALLCRIEVERPSLLS